MNYRELLELAAKAARIDAEFHPETCYYQDGMWLKGARSPDNKKYWNPLTDDGDALRLTVKLGLELYHSINNDRWTAFVGYPNGQRITYVMEEWGDDETSATRRAIVRAAAEIGKQMP